MPAPGQGNLFEQEPFPQAAHRELGNTQMRKNLRHATHTIRDKRLRVVGELPDWEQLRDAGSAIKNSSMIHWARDAQEANKIVTDLVKETGSTEVVKVKSMATQEIGLNEHLETQGIEAFETDLAELIVQLGHDWPRRPASTCARSSWPPRSPFPERTSRWLTPAPWVSWSPRATAACA